MANRAHDWLRQAEHDLELARVARQASIHDWACFAAQQGAEKAIKALHFAHGQEAWGHVVAVLLRELPPAVKVPPILVEKAHVLDAYYVPARYPNGHPAGAPHEHYGGLQSEQAIDYAREILEFVRDAMAEP